VGNRKNRKVNTLKKVIVSMMFLFFLVSFGEPNTFAKELRIKEMEEVLINQFQKQIIDSIKEVYKVEIPQFENASIISIEKEFLTEPSEELKPGNIYVIKLTVNVLNVEDKSMEITLHNDNPNGEFVVQEIKRNK
jgi:hypothetical protein